MLKLSALISALALACCLSAPLYAQDTTPPVAAVVSPADGYYINSLPAAAGTASDDVAVSDVQLEIVRQSDGYFWDGAVFTGTESWLAASLSTPSWSYSAVPAWVDGSSYTVTAKVMDTSANWSVDYSTALFTYDITAPAVAITTPVTGTYASFSSISGTAADAHGVTQVEVSVRRQSDLQYWNGSAWAAGPLWNTSLGTAAWDYAGITSAALDSGATYLFNIRARDLAGNVSDPELASSTFTYVVPPVDSQAPTAAVLQPVNSAFLNALPELSGTAADNAAVSSVIVSILRDGTGLYWNGGSWAAGQAWLGASLWLSSWTYVSVPAWADNSSYTVTAKVMDTSANWSVDYSTALFTYDSLPPSSHIISPAAVISDVFTGVSGTAADLSGVLQVQVSVQRQSDNWYWDGSAWTSGAAWNPAAGTTSWLYAGISTAALQSGTTYLFKLRAYDIIGNVSDSALNPSTFTYFLPPPSVVAPGAFSGLGVSSLTVNWTTTFSTGTPYYVRLATQAAATPYLYSGSTQTAAMPFTGLTPDTSYYGFVSTSAASGFIASGEGRTLAAAPSSVSFFSVYYSSAALSWSGGANPSGTIYEYEISESGSFAVLTSSSSGTAAVVFLSGLAQGGTYYGRVRAVNGAGAPTAYVNAVAPAIMHVLLPDGLVSGLSGSALGVSSISWGWTSGSVSAADYYSLYTGPGVLLATAPFAASGSYAQTGLGPNSAQMLRVAGGNENGEGSLAASATVYTLARVPGDPSAPQVAVSSASITLALNGNPAGTELQLWRSADNLSFSSLYEGPSLSYADAALAECSPYYYKARARNGAGIYSGFSGILSFTTMASTPAAPGGLYAEAQDGARIKLAWEPSPSPSVSVYSVYYDSATGSMDYLTPLAVLPATAASWTTPALASGSSYKFAVRAGGACGAEEKNTDMLASAQAANSLSGVRAAIKVPQTGKRIKGNMVTVVAEVILGLPSQVAKVRFQYSPAGTGAWTDIRSDNVNHSNPDLTAPYFVHLDADALAAGTYDLRAVATDIYGDADPAAPSVTVVTGAADYDIYETGSVGEQSKEQKINNAVASTVQAADDATALITKVVIPSGAVTASTASVTLVNNPAAVPAPPVGSDPLGLAVKVNLSNGQTQLASGRTAALSFTYKDDDGNGIVDGTLAAVDRLRIYTVSDSGGAWTQLDTGVDKEKKTVTAATTHFSFFSVFASAASGLGTVKLYPVPWQPGTGGRFDSAKGVTFSGLPASARIKIFTINGELVRLLEVSAADAGFKIWDGLNSEGHKTASGIYLAVVKAGSDERTLKVAVER